MSRDWVEDFVSEDDKLRVYLGRFSERDEKLWQRVFRGGIWPFPRGEFGVSPDVPAPFSSRPRTIDGGETFSFRHGTVGKRYMRPVPSDRTYIWAPKNLSRKGLASKVKLDTRVETLKGNGAYWIPIGEKLPEGFRRMSRSAVWPRQMGEAKGSARRRQGYIERHSAVEIGVDQKPISRGNIGQNARDRTAFWSAVEAREREDGRVQSTIIADLPYEPEIGAIGRARILENFGREFEKLGLRWHGVTHVPDEHSDPRNFHLHILYHDRPATRNLNDGGWEFARRKHDVPRARGFIKMLRLKYAEIVNSEFQRAGINRRYDPRSYEEMGIPKKPTLHMGVKATALERKGISTFAGRYNYGVEWSARNREVLCSQVDKIERRVRLAEASSAFLALLDEDERRSNVLEAAKRFVDCHEGYLERMWRLAEAETFHEFERNRKEDLPRRMRKMTKYGETRGIRRASETQASKLESVISNNAFMSQRRVGLWRKRVALAARAMRDAKRELRRILKHTQSAGEIPADSVGLTLESTRAEIELVGREKDARIAQIFRCMKEAGIQFQKTEVVRLLRSPIGREEFLATIGNRAPKASAVQCRQIPAIEVEVENLAPIMRRHAELALKIRRLERRLRMKEMMGATLSVPPVKPIENSIRHRKKSRRRKREQER